MRANQRQQETDRVPHQVPSGSAHDLVLVVALMYK
jgi:hypothetical protein